MASAIALLAVLIAPSAAAAESDESQRTMSEQERKLTAEVRHRAAVNSFARQRYRDAIDLFREADRLAPSAAFSFNVARCYDQLGDTPNALASYREYLRRARHPGDEAAVTRRIGRLEARLAAKGLQQVSVLSTPSGATVSIDRQPIGVSPWTGEIAPGNHALELTLPGYEPVRLSFDLQKEHALDLEYALPLEPVPTLAAPTPPDAPRDEPTAARAAWAAEEKRTAARSSRSLRERTGTTAATSVGWAAIGTGTAALGAALVFEVLRRGAEKDAERDTTQIRFAHDLERMRSRQTLARVFGGVGAGLAATGGVLLWIGSPRNEKAASAGLALSCIPTRCEAQLAGKF
jgi:hypothetical protein